MDLSKIPEPSESDLQYLEHLVSQYHGLSGQNAGSYVRVIAHILRHGVVLAKSAKVKVIPDDYIEGEREAIQFFEQFGGNDER